MAALSTYCGAPELSRRKARAGLASTICVIRLVVNRILEWYRAGINPQDKLPFLATYLGHRDIHSTLVYITVTQELLQQANERFRTFASHCLHVSEGVQP